MKKITTLLFSIIGIALIYSCTKYESNIIPEEETVETITPPAEPNNPSPCTSSLTNDQIECSPNIFPNSTITLTSVLSGSTQIDGTVPGFPQGGDIIIRFGNPIAPGIYALVDDSAPTAGQASISMSPSICSVCPFKATSGNLYITETSTQWIAEWCSVNFNSTTVNPNSSVSGKIVTNK